MKETLIRTMKIENHEYSDMPGKLLLVANVSKEHIRKFHIPFINYMKPKGWTVDVACKLDEPVPECDTAYDLPCDRNPFQGGIKKSVSLLIDIIKDNHYDAIICNTLTGGIVARLAKKALGKKAPKLFYINHGLHFFEGAPLSRWIMGYPLEKMMAPLTDVLITINDADYKMAKKHLRVKSVERIHGIGVNIERFKGCHFSAENRNSLRHSIGIHENDYVLTYVAEINENKNQAMLLQVLRILLKTIPNARLLLAGPEHDNGRLKRMCDKYGMRGKVFFLGWRDDIPELLKSSDVYVASSKSEGLGLNLIEAMACNLPVVASKNRGHSEIIHHGNNGYLVEMNDVEEMAKYILELHDNQGLREAMIKQAQNDIVKYEINSVIKEEEKIIRAYL